MEEIKFVSLFPSLNKNNLRIQKNFNNNNLKKTIPINFLLIKNNQYSSKKQEKDFLKNKVKFFSPNVTTNINQKKHNKTDFNYPIVKKHKDINNKISKTINRKRNPLYYESKPMIYKIFDKFDEINKKYNEHSKYYHSFIKEGDNNRKININRNINNLTTFPLLPKNNTKKYFSNVYQRIKTIA